jgi:hypothetical protein
MSEERKQVLEMLAAGKITAEEAERLLDKLEPESGPEDGDGRRRFRGHFHRSFRIGKGSDTDETGAGQEERPLKYLRVVVDSKGGDNVNIRVPLKLIKTGIKLSTMLPNEANEQLEAKGINIADLSGLEGEELIEALRDLSVDVDSADGDTVRIFCE